MLPLVLDRKTVAEMVGLSPVTLTNYTRVGYTDLEYGKDYFIQAWKKGPYFRRSLRFTERGVTRLAMRAYKVYDKKNRIPGSRPRDFAGYDRFNREFIENMGETRGVRMPQSDFAARRKVREQMTAVLAEAYLKAGGCAVPNCPCASHRLGLPQTDQLVAAGLLPLRK